MDRTAKPGGFPYERLDVWHAAIELADLVYRITRSFPADERFGLTNQIRRAVVSVSSNIAEGTSRASSTEYCRFVEMAGGSAFEVMSQATVANRQGYLADAEYQAIRELCGRIGRTLSGLRNAMKRRFRTIVHRLSSIV